MPQMWWLGAFAKECATPSWKGDAGKGKGKTGGKDEFGSSRKGYGKGVPGVKGSRPD